MKASSPIAPAKKQATSTAAQKLARLKKAKARFNKADAAYDKMMHVYSEAKRELDAAIAAL